MLSALLSKDLRRARRNPLPWLTNLAIPICITALIGLAFGGKQEDGALGHIRFAVVDEDQSVLGKFIKGMPGQATNTEKLEPVFMDRKDAMREINDNKVSAVLIIPTNFLSHYLSGEEKVSLELIKNPAESVNPAVMEEMLGAGVTGLNVLARNFQNEFPAYKAAFDGEHDYHEVSKLIEHTGDKLKSLKKYINPPLVGYTTEETPTEPSKTSGTAVATKTAAKSQFNLFGYLLIGMSAMFLLFLANIGMKDLHHELRNRTFERYHTLNQPLMPFVISKILFTVVMLLLSSLIMLGGGSLIFHFQWQHPIAISTLMFCYAIFAACLLAMLTAMVSDERRANTYNNMAGMLLGMAGGCTFPPEQLPLFIQKYVTPILPSHWFAETARELEFGDGHALWIMTAIKLAAVSIFLAVIATMVFRRKFRNGIPT